MAQPAADSRRPQPRSIDLSGIDPTHPESEDTLQLIGTAVAETAAGVTGVHHLGGTAARSLDRASRAVLGRTTSAGVTVSQEDGETTIDVDIVVAYPSKVTEVAEETRSQVSRAASLLTGDRIVVNVTVTDVFAPGDRDVVAEADEAITGAVEKTKKAASDAAEKTRDAAGRASQKAKDVADDVSERSRDAAAQVREKTADAAEEIREGASRAVAAAREGADRASDATREGAAKASDAIDDGIAKARAAAADATDRLDTELAERRSDDSAAPAPEAAPADRGDVTIVVEEGANVTVESGADVTVEVADSDDVVVADTRSEADAAPAPAVDEAAGSASGSKKATKPARP